MPPVSISSVGQWAFPICLMSPNEPSAPCITLMFLDNDMILRLVLCFQTLTSLAFITSPCKVHLTTPIFKEKIWAVGLPWGHIPIPFSYGSFLGTSVVDTRPILPQLLATFMLGVFLSNADDRAKAISSFSMTY